jgi:hypothetical protein
MQNFVGASKLAGNTQNRPEIPKNRTKTLKTEQKQSLEARRSIAGAYRSIAGDNQTRRTQTEDAGNINNNNHRPNRRLQDSDSTSTQLLSKQTRFSGSHLRHLRQPLSAPNTTDQAGQTT